MSSRRRVNVHTLITEDDQQNQLLKTETEQTENNIEVKSDTVKPLKSDTSKEAEGDTIKPVKAEEKLITKISVYLEDEPYIEKLDSLKKQYRKRTKKGTDYNKIIRVLINKATIEDLL